jgi:hypothetical protein
MRIRCLKYLVLFLAAFWTQQVVSENLKHYDLPREPIDVVIPCHQKDLLTLNMSIEGILKYGANIRRVIVISSEKLTDKAEWFDEAAFPFTKKDVAKAIFQDNSQAEQYLANKENRIGWIYQQLLKLYAPTVIPEISSNVLILDADAIFLRPVEFIDQKTGGALFATGIEYYKGYFQHAARLIPWLKRLHSRHSGIAHHMLFQKAIVVDLLETIKIHHQMEPWQALCTCIDQKELQAACISEYEIYFNFALARTDQVKIRQLKWQNINSLDSISECREKGCSYAACHEWYRQAAAKKKKKKK